MRLKPDRESWPRGEYAVEGQAKCYSEAKKCHPEAPLCHPEALRGISLLSAGKRDPSQSLGMTQWGFGMTNEVSDASAKRSFAVERSQAEVGKENKKLQAPASGGPAT
jgi:hypothetical protein